MSKEHLFPPDMIQRRPSKTLTGWQNSIKLSNTLKKPEDPAAAASVMKASADSCYKEAGG